MVLGEEIYNNIKRHYNLQCMLNAHYPPPTKLYAIENTTKIHKGIMLLFVCYTKSFLQLDFKLDFGGRLEFNNFEAALEWVFF
jgi:hypothetical protein